MGIETLGTVMTLQAQLTPKVAEASKPDLKEVGEPSKGSSESVNTDVKVPVVSEVEKGNAFNQEDQRESQREYDNEQLKEVVREMCKSMNRVEPVFGFHEDTNRVTIKIVDKETKELIKEVPPEKTLDMISKVWELAGIIVDEKK